MARLTVALGELTVEVHDRTPWLTRGRLGAWGETVHGLFDRVINDLGETTTTTELAECEDEDCTCRVQRPSIGFRSDLGGGNA